VDQRLLYYTAVEASVLGTGVAPSKTVWPVTVVQKIRRGHGDND
jgi:hypothetical protein